MYIYKWHICNTHTHTGRELGDRHMGSKRRRTFLWSRPKVAGDMRRGCGSGRTADVGPEGTRTVGPAEGPVVCLRGAVVPEERGLSSYEEEFEDTK